MSIPNVILISKHYVFEMEDWLEVIDFTEEELKDLREGDTNELVSYFLEVIDEEGLASDTVSFEKLGELNE
jgi:hypothetical protein